MNKLNQKTKRKMRNFRVGEKIDCISLSKEVIWNCANICSGRTIVDAEIFIQNGLPEPFVMEFERIHEAGFRDEGRILGPDGYVTTCQGVRSLEILYSLAEGVGLIEVVKHSRTVGDSDYEARLLKHELWYWCGSPSTEEEL